MEHEAQAVDLAVRDNELDNQEKVEKTVVAPVAKSTKSTEGSSISDEKNATHDMNAMTATGDILPNGGLEEGEIEATVEETHTLRRVADSIPASAWLVVTVELCERFTYYGLSGVFTNFIQQPAMTPTGKADGPDGQAGALGKGHQTSYALVTFFQFFAYVTPILGAIIADQYLGKFNTICLFAIIYFIGLIFLVMSSLPSAIAAVTPAFAVFVVSLIIIGLGTGGIKSNVSPLVAEQYRKTKKFKRELKTGETVVVDPALTRQTIFMWFYWAINVGSLSAIVTTNSEKYVGFWLAYTIPAVFFFGALFTLYFGRKKYIRRPPTGSVIVIATQAISAFFKHGRKWENVKPTYLKSQGHDVSRIKYDDIFIDELRDALRACRVFIFFPIYWVSYNQLNSNLTSQAAQMATHGVPNDLLQNIDPLALIILIPIMDRIVTPLLRRFGIVLNPIVRITLGFFLGAASMVWSAVIQHLIYNSSPCGMYTDPNCTDFAPINVWWQTPAYVLIAISEIFASITGLEYAFACAPQSMKSIVMSLYLLTTAGGSILGFALVPVALDPHLVWLYTGIAVSTFVFGCIFYACFRQLGKDYDRMSDAKRDLIMEKPIA